MGGRQGRGEEREEKVKKMSTCIYGCICAYMCTDTGVCVCVYLDIIKHTNKNIALCFS